MHSVPLSPETLKNVDCVLIVTNHKIVDWQMIAEHARLVVDSRNVLPGTLPSDALYAMALVLLFEEPAGPVYLSNAALYSFANGRDVDQGFIAETNFHHFVLIEKCRDGAVLALFDNRNRVALAHTRPVVARHLKNCTVKRCNNGRAFALAHVGFLALFGEVYLVLGKADLGFDIGRLANDIFTRIKPFSHVLLGEIDARFEFDAPAL